MRFGSVVDLRDVIEGELHAVELLDDAVRVSSNPAEAYHGIAGARDNEPCDDATEAEAEELRLRKLPFLLYMDVLRLMMRGMFVG